VKKTSNIFFFLSLLLAGYCCQIGRFCTAFNQISTSHTYEKGLTKRVLALRYNQVSVSSEKKLSLTNKKNCSQAVFLFYSYLNLTGSANAPLNRCLVSDFISPELFSSGKRGPPSVA
jgi:hypothetical protein